MSASGLTVKHLIDLDAAPFCHEGWTIVHHRPGGLFEWDPTKVRLHLEPEQQEEGKVLWGTELQKRLQGKPVLNANLLDYLLAHTELVPEEWKRDRNGAHWDVYFWGTVYRGPYGHEIVRSLRWLGDFEPAARGDNEWVWNYRPLRNDFGRPFGLQFPSVVLAR